MEPRRVDLDALLNAHALMRVERPPTLWPLDILDEPFIRLLGELIVVGLLHHEQLAEHAGRRQRDGRGGRPAGSRRPPGGDDQGTWRLGA